MNFAMRTNRMRIERRVLGDVCVLRLAGEFDAPEARDLVATLDDAASAGMARIVVNLREVRFAGAAAIGGLIQARATVRRRNGEVVVSAPSAFVRMVLRALELDHRFRVFPDDAAAIRHFRADRETWRTMRADRQPMRRVRRSASGPIGGAEESSRGRPSDLPLGVSARRS